MKEKAILFLVLFFVVTFFSPLAKANAEVFIIVNKSVKDVTLTRAEIKAIFLGDKRLWSKDEVVTLFLTEPSDSETHREFLKEFVKKTPSQFITYWRYLLFTGKSCLPKKYNENQVLEKVTQTEGAIGYVSTNVKTEDVTVVKILEN